MDPLTAFGLTSNVIQVLSFGLEALSLCRRVCREGSPEPNLSQNSAQLQRLSTKLLESANAAKTSNTLSKEQEDLQDVASKLLNVTTQLSTLLQEVTVVGARRRRAAVVNTAKYILRYKGKIQSLEKAMLSFQNTLNSGLLAYLCSTSEASALQSRQEFSKLDQSLQHFIKQYAQGDQTVAALISNKADSIKEHVSVESAKTRSQLAANIQHLSLNSATTQRNDRFLDSLKYDEMNARRSTIPASHEKTFGWVFDESIQHPWDNFIHWLKSDEKNFYWISGKPGSGKSTLMKFIINSDETKKVLLEWNPNVTIIEFFFWNSGTKLQRSILGMLSSLLHQISRGNVRSLLRLLQREPALAYKATILDWSVEELQDAILEVFSDRTYKYCLFIDGLDEIEYKEGQAELLRILDKLRRQPNVKLCISSRPEPVLKESLQTSPKLRLQDLTRDDIRQYVTEVLGPIEKVLRSNKDESKIELVNQILEKADGVFLWVKLIAKSLQTGATNADDYGTLMKRVDRLPRDLDQLYNHMWSRLNEDQELYRAEAAVYFSFVLHALENRAAAKITLFELMVACEKSLDDQILDDDSSELIRLCRMVAKRATVRCAGLLEIVGDTKDDLSLDVDHAGDEGDGDTALSKLRHIARTMHVSFIHRSAREFLRETDAGRQILSHCCKSDEEHWSNLIRATMVQATLPLIAESKSGPGFTDWYAAIEGISYSEYIMQGFAVAQEALSEQTVFRLLDLSRKLVEQDTSNIGTSVTFLCLAARFGHSEYVRYHLEQLELRYGCILVESRSRLLHSASIWPERWVIRFDHGHNLSERITPGRMKLVSWLLENGADPNLMLAGAINELGTSFVLTFKGLLAALNQSNSFRNGLKEKIFALLQVLLNFLHSSGDLSTSTLIYLIKSERDPLSQGWSLKTNCPVYDLHREFSQLGIIAIQVNCSWLIQSIIARLKAKGWCEDEETTLSSRCHDVKPEFEVVQMFSQNSHLADSELDSLVRDNSNNLEELLQRRLHLDYNVSQQGKGERFAPDIIIGDVVQSIYERNPIKVEQKIQDWMVEKGWRSADNSHDERI